MFRASTTTIIYIIAIIFEYFFAGEIRNIQNNNNRNIYWMYSTGLSI